MTLTGTNMFKGNWALIAAVCSVAGCAGLKAPVEAGVTVVDSAGTQIVNNVTPEWTDASRWRLDSVPTTRVGHDESEVQSQFRSIIGATRLANGNIVIAADNEVHLFGPDGKFIRTVASRGNGPGEFASGGSMLKLPDDSILVWQEQVGGERKIAIFGADGSFIREERPDADARRNLGPWHECQSMVLRDRSWLGCKSDSTIPVTATNRPSKLLENGFTSPGAGLLRQFQRWHLIPAKLDTTHPIGIDGGVEQFGVARNGGGVTFIVHPYYSRSYIASGGEPLRIATLTNPDYSFEIWTPDGRLERIVRRVNGRRVPTADEKAALPELLSKWNIRREGQADVAASVPTPDSLPAADGLRIGVDGHIAVARGRYLLTRQPWVYDIFNPNGRWLGELKFPTGVYLFELGTDYVLAVHFVDDDVPVVEVYPLHRGTAK